MEIFTESNQPFRIGAPSPHYIKTEIGEEYVPIQLPHDFEGILVRNPIKKLWHVAEVSTGGIIATGPKKKALLAELCESIAETSKETLDQQLLAGAALSKKAEMQDCASFFRLFTGKDRT